MKKIIKVLSIALLTNPLCFAQKTNLEKLVVNASSKLSQGQQIKYHFNITDNKSKTISSGTILLMPQKNPDAFGFDVLEMNLNNGELKVIKNFEDIYVKQKNEKGIFSNLRRLGAPLLSKYISNYILPYQYLSILRDYKKYNPKLGKQIKREKGILQEIVFDIPDYDFHAAFWINTKSHLLEQIDTKGEHGTIQYKITNFFSSNKKLPAPIFNKNEYEEYFSGLPPIGKESPNWSLPKVDNGQVFTNEQFKGKVLVLDFWATWCQPCLAFMPKMDSLYRTLDPNKVQFVSITHDENKDPNTYLRKMQYSQLFLNGNTELSKTFGLQEVGIPTVFVIDQNGIVRDFESGFQGEKSIAHLKEVIDSLLMKINDR